MGSLDVVFVGLGTDSTVDDVGSGGRSFPSLEQAASMLLWSSEACVVVLAHESQQAGSVSLKAVLEPDASGTSSLDFAHALRRRHPFGMILPIIYLASEDSFSDEQWVHEERTSGPLAPTLIVRSLQEARRKAVELADRWTALVSAVENEGRREGISSPPSETDLPVVVVDDDPNLRQQARYRLALVCGYDVTCFSTLKEAAAALLGEEAWVNSPFILILDHDMTESLDAPLLDALQMPRTELQDPPGAAYGWRLASQLRLLHPYGLALPIAYYSGNAEMKRASQWTEQERSEPGLSPSAYFSKAVVIDDVAAEMQEHYEMSMALLQAAQLNLLVSALDEDDADEES